ncbi:hypothetical protein [Pelagicoccus sp. SDUM812003]|uniref:hypothetical protein n=1 Tax=Pelagicoccus sp. SDUM812003 TaxID=3041267 RepID=UPI00280D715C|nr:hypothetical protein [Pelagicoccus sp. SDUM812003]MDQ8204801.1 hypothetical protein [Pelagicoccus sp. SDUM812003]
MRKLPLALLIAVFASFLILSLLGPGLQEDPVAFLQAEPLVSADYDRSPQEAWEVELKMSYFDDEELKRVRADEMQADFESRNRAAEAEENDFTYSATVMVSDATLIRLLSEETLSQCFEVGARVEPFGSRLNRLIFGTYGVALQPASVSAAMLERENRVIELRLEAGSVSGSLEVSIPLPEGVVRVWFSAKENLRVGSVDFWYDHSFAGKRFSSQGSSHLCSVPITRFPNRRDFADSPIGPGEGKRVRYVVEVDADGQTETLKTYSDKAAVEATMRANAPHQLALLEGRVTVRNRLWGDDQVERSEPRLAERFAYPSAE